MKKFCLTLVAVIAMIQFSFAQWSTVSGTNNISNSNTGNVGIGTTTPGAKLDVNGGLAVKGLVINDIQSISTPADGTYVIASGSRIKGTYTLSFEAANRVQTVVLLANGVQFDGANSSLSVLSDASYAGAVVMLNFRFVFNSDGSIVYLVFDIANRNSGISVTASFSGTGYNPPNWGGALPASQNAGTIFPLVIKSGNVLIGQNSQTNAAYILDVNGTVRAKAIMVNATGADFVFDLSYKLNTLPKLKEYIDQNHHLPEIASAKEMQTNGVDLGQNQVKLLQKVEELTLYLIDKDKQLNDEKDIIGKQQQEIDQLKQQMQQFMTDVKKSKNDN